MKESSRWWEADEADAHDVVFRLVRELSDRNRPDKERMLRCLRLYDPNANYAGASIEVSNAPWPFQEISAGVVINVVQSAIDTVRSMISKNRPAASFQTDGADFTTTRLAKDLEKFCEAKAHQVDLYEDLEQMFFEAAQVGSGFVKGLERDGEIDVEVVPWEAIEVDQEECIGGGEPRSMHEIRFVSRSVAAALFPDHADFLETIPEHNGIEDGLRRFNSYQQFDSDMIPLVESWHKPSAKGAGDGRHSIVAEGITLLWEDWSKDHFPIIKFDWAKRPRGYFGIGLAEMLAGIQNRINRLYSYVSRCHNLANTFLSVGAADATLKLRASGGQGASPVQVLVSKDPNRPPAFLTPQLVQPEVYQHLIWLIQMAYQLAGISENAARSEVPRQFESSVAINTYNDIQTQRFSIQAQKYEKTALRVFELMVELQGELSEGDKTEVYYRTGDIVKRIRWKDLKTKKNFYTMSIESSSLMSRTPSARQQAAIELGNAGLYERDELRRLVGHPDLKRVDNLKNAALDHAEAVLEKLLDGESGVVPEPLDNIPVMLQVISNGFLKAKDEGAPEEILDGLRSFLMRCTNLLNMTPPPPQQPMQPPQGAPPPINAAGMPLG